MKSHRVQVAEEPAAGKGEFEEMPIEQEKESALARHGQNIVQQDLAGLQHNPAFDSDLKSRRGLPTAASLGRSNSP